MFKIAVVCESMTDFRNFVQADMPRHVNYRTCDATSRQVNYYPILPSTDIYKVLGHFFDEVHILTPFVLMEENVWDYIRTHSNRYKSYPTTPLPASGYRVSENLSIIERIQRIEKELGL